MIRINPYEIMLLIEPDVPEERHREVIERVQQIVEKGKGSWGGVEPWGRRKLAYEIKHTGEAWYYVLTFDAPAPTHRPIRLSKQPPSDEVRRGLPTVGAAALA